MTANADPAERDMAAVAGALLAQGWRIDAVSRPVMVLALVGLPLPAVIAAPPLLTAILGLVALVGLAELYLAIRVGFDAALFRRLGQGAAVFDLARLDRALSRLALIPSEKTGRPIEERVAGARRLLRWQGVLLAAQAVLLLIGAGLALLPARSGG